MLKKYINYSLKVFVSLMNTIFLLRIYELIFFTFLSPSKNAFSYELLGFLADLSTASFYYLIIIIFCLLFIWCSIVYKVLLHVFALLIILLSLSTLCFFITARVPLDHAIFSYSFLEIITTIKSSQLGIMAYLMIFVPILAYYLFFIFFKIKDFKILKIIMFTLIVISPALYFSFKPYIENVNNVLNNNLTKNKPDFFIAKSLKFLNKDSEQIKLESNTINEFIKYRTIDGFYKKANVENKALNEGFDKNIALNYPLLHFNNFNPLDEYFKPFETHPNIVIIVFESLGDVFFDKNVYTASFLPFIDSLKNNSLYWSNCFSTSERTFNVTPSVLGSLPYGKTGFCDIDTVPNHLSIISLLRKNNYYASFFYGGWIGFHNMGKFHRYQQTDYMKEYFPLDKYRSTESKIKKGEFHWGFSDGDLMKRSIDVIDSVNKFPMMNYYMTLSTHSPFSLPADIDFKEPINKIIDKQKVIDKKNLKANIETYTAFYYSDNCISELIKDYQRKRLYQNTIFIITGDHYSHEIGGGDKLNVYNVPLIIHSPLLNRNAHFEAIVSHLDIVPSLINLLSSRGVIEAPRQFHWMGYGLETNNEANKKFIPFMKNNKDIEDCIWQNYFYSEDKLYVFENVRNLRQIENEEIKKQIINRLNNFKKINTYTCYEQKILP